MENISERGMIVERTIDEDAFEKYGVIEFLSKKGLIKSARFVKRYSPSLVQEFYSNLIPAVKTSLAKGFHHVFVRAQMVEFSS